MTYKFENLGVWQRSLEYADKIHEIADQRPKHERYNLAGMGPRTTDRRRRFAECQFAGISLKTVQISGMEAYGLQV